MGEKRRQLEGSIMLAVCAMIWGIAFVAQSAGMDHVGPCTFNGVRNFIGCVALLPLLAFRRKKGLSPSRTGQPVNRKLLLWGGVLCGLFLCAASLFQQFGIQYASAGKAGFLTALYIVIVPILGIFLGRRPGLQIWIGVVLALAGTYLLSVTDGFSIAQGDLLLLACALLFSMHIMVVDRIAPQVDGVMLSWIQFFVSGVISLALAFFWEKPSLSSVLDAWLPLLYTGVLSSGVGYTLQILGQQRANPTVASLLMSLESVFAALAGWVLLSQALSARELFGCGLVFVAVVVAQLPGFPRRGEKKP